MDKRLLSKIKRPFLPEDFHRGKEEHIVITTEIKIINHKKILIVNFFTDKDFESAGYSNRLSVYLPCFRVFIEKNDYVTQDLSIEKTKWYKGSLRN